MRTTANAMSKPRAILAAAIAALLAVGAGHAFGQNPVPPACVKVTGAGDSGVYVNLANDTTPEAIAHIRDAVTAGKARILHWDPADADAHRKASLRGIPTRKGFDRDEYPPAASAEGGAGADVRYIASSDNRSAGQRMGAVMRPFCAGQAFIVEP